MLPESLRKVLEEWFVSIPLYYFPASSIIPQLESVLFLCSVPVSSLAFSFTAIICDTDSPPVVKHVRVHACMINIRLVSYLPTIEHTWFWGCKGIRLEMSCITLWRLMYTSESLTAEFPVDDRMRKDENFDITLCPSFTLHGTKQSFSSERSYLLGWWI